MTAHQFLVQNAAVLLAAAGISLVLLLVWVLGRSFRLERRLGEILERQEHLLRDQERNLNRELSSAREEMLNRVARGQRDEQRAILESGNRIFQGMERRFGELNEHVAEDAGDLRTALVERFERLQQATAENLAEGRLSLNQSMTALRESLDQALARHRERLDQRQGEALKAQQEGLATGMAAVAGQVNEALAQHGEVLAGRIQKLTEVTDQRLREISGQVERRLAEGFEKTTETFSQVLQHLSRIDEAQKKITELSGNVVSLQEILSDKRSRGAFGEVQLNALVRNILPEGSYAFQHTLAAGTRVDCLLRLPDPTGDLAVDAKFPLESFQRMTDIALPAIERDHARRRFRQDIKKHVHDISSRYIVEGETSDGALMFIPAEAVFAEIHAHHPEVVAEAQRQRVWLVSPTTLMAVLTTARAVLRDVATQEQVHVIREHLHAMSKDFGRFQERMDRLATHIARAHREAEDVHKSASRISGRFRRIEEVDLDENAVTLPLPDAAAPEAGEASR